MDYNTEEAAEEFLSEIDDHELMQSDVPIQVSVDFVKACIRRLRRWLETLDNTDDDDEVLDED